MDKPKMTVFAGTNGAGKSTLTDVMVAADRVGEVIDADAIAKQMNPANPESVSIAAGREALKRVQNCIDHKRDFSIETTLAGGNVMRQMQRAAQSGYAITMFYVGLKNVDFHVERVARRVEEGGHHIPEEDIRRRYDRSLQNVPKAISLADRSFIFDNSTGYKMMMEFDKGKIIFAAPQLPKWVNDIARSWVHEQKNQIQTLKQDQSRYYKELKVIDQELVKAKEILQPVEQFNQLKEKIFQLNNDLEEMKPKSWLEKFSSLHKKVLEGMREEIKHADIQMKQLSMPSAGQIEAAQREFPRLHSVSSALKKALETNGQDLENLSKCYQSNQRKIEPMAKGIDYER
ncbi:AAA family ATPase [Paenibacillus sp. N10]|uniref:UDP-N-acetylglucosamine kinase n=1 Tax=Paenibacillus lutrae TaxID=2078573 RepID=A0A7X3K1K4_9BACL|nr:AAA family ATPase [Paenibacillus lutrae]